MSKEKSKRQKVKEGFRRRRPLRPKDLPVGMYDGMREALGRPPQVQDLQDINFAAIQEVMRRTVQLRLAQWLHTVMIILRDNFDFQQEDLARFSRLFREGTKALAEHEAAQAEEKENDQTENSEA